LLTGVSTVVQLLALDRRHVATVFVERLVDRVQAAAVFFQDRREHSRRRQAVIAANTSLQERELIKLASLSAAVAEALRRRGVADPAATLTAEAGIAVFKVAFDRWVDEAGDSELSVVMADTLRELRAVTGQ
jgi:MftR C-terminal domain